VGLVVLGQVGLLPETLAAEGAAERLLAGVGPDVDIDGVAVLETLESAAQKLLRLSKTWPEIS
jgi:hypothetical protein